MPEDADDIDESAAWNIIEEFLTPETQARNVPPPPAPLEQPQSVGTVTGGSVGGEVAETLVFADDASFREAVERLERDGDILDIIDGPGGIVSIIYQRHRVRRGVANPFGITNAQYFSGVNPIGLRNAFRSLDDFSSPSLSNSLDKETHLRLIRASDLLDDAKRKRTQQMQQLRGRREGQYIKMLRNDKRRNMTFIEIVGSEVPIRLAEFGWSKVRQILDTIRMSEVESKEGKYTMHCANGDCKLENVPYDYAYFCNNHLFCSEHIPDLKLCDVCVELYAKTKIVKTYDSKVLNICSGCSDRFLERGCRQCRGNATIEYISAGMCIRCVEKNPHSSPYHSFSKSLRWMSTDKGEVVQSPRIYSTEIEALSPSIDHAQQLYKGLPAEVGIATDGSVTANDGRAYGFELQTPRLAGKRGEELVRRMCAATKEVEAHVNESCGMHVHIDGKGLMPQDRKEYPAAIIQLWKAYLVFEGVLMSLVPYSRRNNDFCRRLSEAFQINELDTIENMFDVEKMWYKARTTQDIRQAKGQHYSPTRYFGVNFHCLLNDGHFEIRFHPGTLNPKKVLEWANLHSLIADAAVRLAFDQVFLREAQATYHLQEKATLLFDRLGMSKASKEFYLSRQRKFADKKSRDDETRHNGEVHRGNSLTTEEN